MTDSARAILRSKILSDTDITEFLILFLTFVTSCEYRWRAETQTVACDISLVAIKFSFDVLNKRLWIKRFAKKTAYLVIFACLAVVPFLWAYYINQVNLLNDEIFLYRTHVNRSWRASVYCSITQRMKAVSYNLIRHSLHVCSSVY